MTINPSQIASAPLSGATDFAIEVFYNPLKTSEPLATPRTPGQLLAYYNNARGVVELFVVGTNGRNVSKVR